MSGCQGTRLATGPASGSSCEGAAVFQWEVDIATIESLEQRLIWLKAAQRRQPALQVELLRAAPIARGTVAQVWNRGNAAQAMAKRWVRERRVAAEVIRLLE